MKKLAISQIAPGGALVTLSDGRTYLVQQDHQGISARWAAGETVLVSGAAEFPNSFTLLSLTRSGESVIAAVK